ncbi:MAG: hypothetical protein LH479_07960 [Polaromonas sp.]|nr:hypothetical protein [Polaromonas sp.]
MKITPFFVDLYAAYQAELDDLTFDSEQNNVLARRLHDKRQQMAFLVKMMELSPEMVAVVFHRGFEFRLPAVMDDLLGLDAEDFPRWTFLADSVHLAAWAQPLATAVLREPQGERLMTVAAALEYMVGRAAVVSAASASDEDDAEGDNDNDSDTDDGRQSDDGQADADGPGDAQADADSRAAIDAGADWLVAQGFDRKD